MQQDINQVIADNVRRLKDSRGDTQKTIAVRGGLSQRSVGYVLTYGTTHETAPTARTIEGLAKAFELPPWQLLVPDLPVDQTQNHVLAEVVAQYLALPDSARANVVRIVQSESRYAQLELPKQRKPANAN